MVWDLGKTLSRSTAPTANPATSYSPEEYIPGISAVSPVIKAVEQHNASHLT